MDHQRYPEGMNDMEKNVVDEYRRILGAAKPNKILEIGSGWGIFSWSAVNFSSADILSVDKNELEDLKAFEIRVGHMVGSRIELWDGTSSYEAFQKMGRRMFDLILVDGSHNRGDVLSDIMNAFYRLNPGGTLLIDDIFHKKNWECKGDGLHDYGVATDLWLWLCHHPSVKQINILNVGHGLGVVIK